MSLEQYAADSSVLAALASSLHAAPGDFLGEMSFVSGSPASATAVVVKPLRYLGFDQGRLRQALGADSDLKQALDASFNRNLVGKLAKAGQGAAR